VTDFVLVHGGWHGGWCWSEVAAILRDRGHRVWAPSLTGLAERAHLIDAVEGPDTHVEDIARLIEFEDLTGITLVGHSYGGTIVTGVASRMPGRIARLVYLDAFVPTESGVGPMAMSNPERAAEVAAARRPDGHIDPTGFERWVSPERIDWLISRATAQPAACFGKGVTLTGGETQVPRRDYILCTRHRPSPFWRFHETYLGAPGWVSHELDSLHDAMIEAPGELAGILAQP
jgi:pimeloyl-ACP methyl ester carboxylesterase